MTRFRDLGTIAAALGGVLVMVAVLVALPGPASAQETLRQAVTRALANHPRVAAAAFAEEAAAEQVQAARSGFFPRVAVSGSGGYGFREDDSTRAEAELAGDTDEGAYGYTTSANVRLSQMLFDGLGTANRTQAARADVAQRTAQLQDAEEQIALRAAQAYLDLMRSRAILEIAALNVENHLEVLAEVRRKLEAGAGDAGDVAQAESRLALAQARLIDITGQAERAEFAYTEAVGGLPTEGVTQPDRLDAFLPIDRAEAIQIALENNPALNSLWAAVDAADARVDASVAPLLPRLDADLDYNRIDEPDTFDGKSEEATALLRFSWSLSTGGAEFARRDAARAQRSEARARADERARTLQQQVSNAYTAVEVARAQLAEFYVREAAANEVVRSYRRQFEAARRSLLDVLDVENELFEARIAAANGVFRVLGSEYTLLAQLGRLIRAIEIATANEAPLEPASAN